MTVDAVELLEDLLERARAAAFGPRQFVGQESFVTRSEVLSLAEVAGLGAGTRLLDICCGTAGPGLFVAGHAGCAYVGVDARPASVARARRRAEAAGIDCRVEVGRVPPLPTGRFDVVLLLETLLAFPRRSPLLAAVAEALAPGGRFALTVEAGRPLTPDEARTMPDADTVWLTPLDDLVAELRHVGLHVTWEEEWTASHRASADALLGAYEELARALPDAGEREVVERLVTSHRLWSRWLRDGRVRKHALVVEAMPGGLGHAPPSADPRGTERGRHQLDDRGVDAHGGRLLHGLGLRLGGLPLGDLDESVVVVERLVNGAAQEAGRTRSVRRRDPSEQGPQLVPLPRGGPELDDHPDGHGATSLSTRGGSVRSILTCEGGRDITRSRDAAPGPAAQPSSSQYTVGRTL